MENPKGTKKINNMFKGMDSKPLKKRLKDLGLFNLGERIRGHLVTIIICIIEKNRLTSCLWSLERTGGTPWGLEQVDKLLLISKIFDY